LKKPMTLKLLAGVTCLSAGLMFAQAPGGARRGPGREAALLGLTADQQTLIKTTRTTAATQSKPLRDQVRTLREELNSAIKAGDTGKIDSLTPSIAQIEGQIGAIDAKAQSKIYGSLTADQKAKVDAAPGGLGRLGMMMGGRRGPGGPPPAPAAAQ
jgi:Spy/CpxP family protein refolding chaperone